MHGEKHVSARRGRAGEKSDFFGILLDEGRKRRIDDRIADQPF